MSKKSLTADEKHRVLLFAELVHKRSQELADEIDPERNLTRRTERGHVAKELDSLAIVARHLIGWVEAEG